MFNDLIWRWQVYMEAAYEQPYNADKVQALGMWFAAEWNQQKEAIKEALNISEEDWGYNHRAVIPQLLKREITYKLSL